MSNWLGALIITAAIFIGVFLLTREFWCWYFKINERLQVEKAILAALRGSSAPAAPGKRSPADRYAAGEISKEEYLATQRG